MFLSIRHPQDLRQSHFCHEQVPSAPVPQRASTRRQPKVDFSKLDVSVSSASNAAVVWLAPDKLRMHTQLAGHKFEKV